MGGERDEGEGARELAGLEAELRVLATQGAALARQRAVLTATTARLDAEAARLTRDLVSARAKLKAAEVKLGLGPTHASTSATAAAAPGLRASAVLVGLRARSAALLEALPEHPHLVAPPPTLAPVHTLAGPDSAPVAHIADIVAARTCTTYPLVEDRSRRVCLFFLSHSTPHFATHTHTFSLFSLPATGVTARRPCV